MAQWGIAYAAGPNYNKPWEAFDEVDMERTVSEAYVASRRALELADGSTPVERALFEALPHRYPAEVPAEDCSIWNDAYAAAMRDVYARFPDDLDVATLFAEALMNRTPWQLWDLTSGEPASGADTVEAIGVLEAALARMEAAGDGLHPGLLHMYIHLMEMSPHPERALRVGDQLRNLVPDAGHLCHMPTHIDVLCGLYNDVVVGNERAIEADRSTSSVRGRSTSTRSTAATTSTSGSTERCSSASSGRRSRRPTRWCRPCPMSSCGSRCRPWPTGSRASSR